MRLKNEDIIEIVKMIDEGIGLSSSAQKYNYNVKTMNKIINRYKKHGINGILHKNSSNIFSQEFKLKIINMHYEGQSINSLAVEINVSDSVVRTWIKKYEQLGYNGLIDNRGRPGVTKVGRPRKNQTKPAAQQAPLTDPEREELNELRKRNRRLEMELEATKKLQALVQERIKRETPKK